MTIVYVKARLTLIGVSMLQAVDVVGQAGKPKTITGFQTHTTPVLLAFGERAELATEECILSDAFHTSVCCSRCLLHELAAG